MGPEQPVAPGDRILTRPFLILAGSGLLFYLSMAATQSGPAPFRQGRARRW